MRMVCRIEKRYPVAIALLSGTADHTAIVDAVVALRDVLADQPVALVLDLGQLHGIEAAACKAMAELARDAGQWPGSWVAIGDASPAARQELTRYAGQDELALFDDTKEAVATAERIPVPPLVTVELPPERTAPASCREVVAETWHQWGLPRGERLVQLLASELVTNAVVHARTPIWFTIRQRDNVVQVAVRDQDPRLVARPPRGPHELPEGDPGRGLLLLETLADDWGCTPTGDGKTTWACVALTSVDR
jgi:anti-sigma regulatory factor (Ser/Thr protein kinase)